MRRLTVFQRTGNWFLPRKNKPLSGAAAGWRSNRVPRLQDWRRRFVFEYTESLTLMIRNPRTFGRLGALRSAAFMRSQLKDEALREKAWPDYIFGCKRILFSSEFLPALERPNVELVTDAIEAIVPEGIRTADGRTHEVDCLIWATGFRTNDFMFPMAITGRGGRSLGEAWAERRARAPRHHRARLPEHVRPLRAQHEHLGRLDHLLPRTADRLRAPGAGAADRARRRRDRGAAGGRGGLRPRAAGPLRRAPRGRSATPGTATRTAASSRTGPATCASTCG